MRKSQKDARWDGSPTSTISDRSSLPPDIRRDVETNHRGNPILTPELEVLSLENSRRGSETLREAGKLGAFLLQLSPSFQRANTGSTNSSNAPVVAETSMPQERRSPLLPQTTRLRSGTTSRGYTPVCDIARLATTARTFANSCLQKGDSMAAFRKKAEKNTRNGNVAE